MHHFGLVGDTMELYVGRQEDRCFRQLFIDLLTESDDIMPRHHLHIQDQAGPTVIAHILRRFLVPTGDGGYVLET